jgi:hypothetical protein
MAHSNDVTRLLNKIERHLEVKLLTPHLPEGYRKEDWWEVIEEESLVTFSRYYPNRLRMMINDETCYKKKDDADTLWYYIKDEVLQGCKLLGIMDIDWTDHTTANASLGTSTMLGNYYYPSMACPTETFETVLGLQMNADMASLYNRGIYIDYEYPNRFALKGLANTSYDLERFVVILLVEHASLSTISPTMMETFEQLAQCDICRAIFMHLRYEDQLETVYLVTDLKLGELEQEANRRQEIIDKLEQSYVTASNSNIPYIMTING